MAVKEVNIGHLAIFFFSFLPWEKNPESFCARIENTMGNQLFYFFNVDQNTSTKKI